MALSRNGAGGGQKRMRAAAILGLALGLACAAAAQPLRVAVFADQLPGVDTSAVRAAAALLEKRAEYSVRRISILDLASPAAFNASLADVLVLGHSRNLTYPARQNLTAYLKSGGDLVLLGGYGFVQPGSMTLPAFSKYEPYVLDGIESVVSYPGQDLAPAVEIKGRFEGYSAIGFTRRAARFIPILTARDRYGRDRGWACGLLSHFAEYPGSNFLLFGISTPAFYETPGFARVLTSTLTRMRGDALTKEAETRERERLSVRIRLSSPAPAGFVRRSPDGRHLLLPDGRRFFITGLNYHRSLDEGEWFGSKGAPFDEASFEDDFRKARDAGINCFRLGPANRFYENPDFVKECARKYGIYLLVLITWGAGQDYVENAERVARMYADEPMVMGYDLANEPSFRSLASLAYDGEESPVVRFGAAEKFAGLLDRKAVDDAVAQARGRRPAGVAGESGLRNLVAFEMLWNHAKEHLVRGAETTFPGLTGQFRLPGEYQALMPAADQTLSLWIRKHIEAIRKHDRNHLITVGYNNTLACLPANRDLDFISHHVYEWPLSYEMVVSNITAMDRLAALFPDKPVTLGEFGYTNGLVMPDGRYLDFHTSAVGEMMHFLHALAKGYDGCTKWVLTDWHWDVIGKAGERGRSVQIYEAYFGLYWYDGNPRGLGRMKPIGYATRFLRDYVDSGGDGGSLEIRRAKTAVGAAYTYRNRNALFVGDYTYASPELEFRAEKPANVMIAWDGKGIKAMSTCDAEVRINPEALGARVTAAGAKVTGGTGRWSAEGKRLRIQMLEGETVTIR